jgi:hypothetical protein
MRHVLFVAFGVFMLASPWWGTVITQYGFAPFRSALDTGGSGTLAGLSLIFGITEERFIAVVSILGLLGLVAQMIHRDWFLPV